MNFLKYTEDDRVNENKTNVYNNLSFQDFIYLLLGCTSWIVSQMECNNLSAYYDALDQLMMDFECGIVEFGENEIGDSAENGDTLDWTDKIDTSVECIGLVCDNQLLVDSIHAFIDRDLLQLHERLLHATFDKIKRKV